MMQKKSVRMLNEAEVHTLCIVHHGRTHGVLGTAAVFWAGEGSDHVFLGGKGFFTYLIRLGRIYRCINV